MKRPISLQSRTRLCSKFRLPGLAVCGLLLLSPALHAAMPPDPSAEFRFPEGGEGVGGAGVITTNTGTLGGFGTFAQPFNEVFETNPAPVFTTNVPVGVFAPAGNDFSVDMGLIQGSSLGGSSGRAIDLSPEFGDGFGIGAFPELTICGWLNMRQLPAIEARIVYAHESPNGLGFNLAQINTGQLRLGINQYNPPATVISASSVPVDANTGSNNWVFVAVTYDPNLADGQVKFYFGRPDKLAVLDATRDYTPSFTTVDYTGPLALGNYSPIDGARDSLLGGNTHIFRGLIDDVKVYTNALTLDEVQQAQLNAAVTPFAAYIIRQPANVTASEYQNPTFTVDATGSGLVTYQWKTNGVDVSGATNASLTLNSVLLTDDGTVVTVGVSNSVDGVLSDPATLTVVPAEPRLVAVSFTEGVGTVTTNVGSVNGIGRLKVVSGFPRFISTNAPTGPFAPSPAHNLTIHHGSPLAAHRAVDVTNTIVSPHGELGSLNALTICGWLNSANHSFRTTSTGRGVGIVNASKGGNLGGFALAYRPNDLGVTYGQLGRLQLHVNEWNTGANPASPPPNLSSESTILLDTNLPVSNWQFFAVTYDGTATTDNLAFYFGDANTTAALDVVQTYNQGIIAGTGPLAIGNHNSMPGDPNTSMAGNPTGRNTSGDNGTAFRGLLDEIKIFSKVLTLEEIQAEQGAPAVPTRLFYSNSGSDLVLSWETLAAYPYQLQSRTNLDVGDWGDVTASETVVDNVHSVTVPQDKETEFFRIERQ